MPHACGRQPCQRTRSLYHTPRCCCRDQIRSSPKISDCTWNELWPCGLGDFHFRCFVRKNKVTVTSVRSYTGCGISYFILTDRTCLYKVWQFVLHSDRPYLFIQGVAFRTSFWQTVLVYTGCGTSYFILTNRTSLYKVWHFVLHSDRPYLFIQVVALRTSFWQTVLVYTGCGVSNFILTNRTCLYRVWHFELHSDRPYLFIQDVSEESNECYFDFKGGRYRWVTKKTP